MFFARWRGTEREREREREREGEREKGARFEFRIETGVSVLARVIVPRTVLFGYNECMEGEAGMIVPGIKNGSRRYSTSEKSFN